MAEPPGRHSASAHHRRAQHHYGQNAGAPLVIVNLPASPVARATEIAATNQNAEKPPWKQWDFWTAIGTLILAGGTIGLVVKTAALVRSAERATERQLRAYVSVDLTKDAEWKPTLVYGKGPSNITFVLKNHGATPALNVKLSGDMDILPYPMPGEVPILKMDPESSVMVLFPGHETGRTHISSRRSFDATDKMRIQSGTHRLYAFGQIDYVDIFKRSHCTRFRYMMNADKGLFAECPEGNETDD